ncbi:hypothetical protein MHK_003306 [Candidatus Magnetomorum sp. HK-1]|nr:hypothetical protein MHK_003306 [Candidatus Magnetomorum sp. HK-1]
MTPFLSFSNLMPNVSYFDSRFDIMQNNIDEVRRNQDNFREQLRDMKSDMDRRFNENRSDMLDRFAQVDKRFEQVDKRFEQVDKRFETSHNDMVDRFKQVDKRLEQIILSIEKLSDKIDKKDEKLNLKINQRDEIQRKFTLRMFSISLSVTGLSVMGILMKVLNLF